MTSDPVLKIQDDARYLDGEWSAADAPDIKNGASTMTHAGPLDQNTNESRYISNPCHDIDCSVPLQ
jgi:hypothetical protein